MSPVISWTIFNLSHSRHRASPPCQSRLSGGNLSLERYANIIPVQKSPGQTQTPSEEKTDLRRFKSTNVSLQRGILQAKMTQNIKLPFMPEIFFSRNTKMKNEPIKNTSGILFTSVTPVWTKFGRLQTTFKICIRHQKDVYEPVLTSIDIPLSTYWFQLSFKDFKECEIMLWQIRQRKVPFFPTREQEKHRLASPCKHVRYIYKTLRSWQAIPLLRVRVKGRELIDIQRMQM